MPLACPSLRSILSARVGWAAVLLRRMVAGLFRTVGPGDRRDVMLRLQIESANVTSISLSSSREQSAGSCCTPLLAPGDGEGRPRCSGMARLTPGGRDRLTRMGAW